MRLRSLHGSLAAKIIAWSFVPTLLILSVVAVFVYQTYQRVLESQVFERDRQLTGLRAQQMAAQLSDLGDTLRALAAVPDISRFEPVAQQLALQWSVNRLGAFDGGVIVVDTTGRVVASDPRRTLAELQDWPGQVAVNGLMQGHGQILFSDVFMDEPGGASAAVGVPVLGEDGRYRGLLAGIIRLGNGTSGPLQERLSRAGSVFVAGETAGTSSIAYVVDGQGRVLYHANPALRGLDGQLNPELRFSILGKSGARHTYGLLGQETLASYATLPGTSWSLIVEDDWQTLASSYQGYERGLLVLLVLALVVPAVVVAAGVRRITRPIADLTQAAEQMASGNLSRPIAVHTGDELERLARQFNLMSAQLKESHDQLEGRVAARTRELSTLNAISALVSRSLDLEEVLCTALEETLAVLDLKEGLAYRVSEREAGDRVRLGLVAHRGLTPEAGGQIGSIARLEWQASPAAGSQSLAVRRTEEWPAGELREWATMQGWQAAISLPLAAKGRLMGTMILGIGAGRSSRLAAGGPLSNEELAMLAAIGQQTGVALENARLYRQAEQSAVAAERNRLAHELHDSVTQTLFAASMIAGVLPALWERNPAGGRRRLEELRLLTQGALAEMRTLLLELRPGKLTEIPLGELLQQLAAAARMRAQVPIQVEVKGQAALPGDVQIAFYRVAQESLNNMAKYAVASEATITLRVERAAASPASSLDALRVVLTVADDGCGFDPVEVAGNHLGLGIMRERAASVGAHLEVDSRPGGGTRVQMAWVGNTNQREEVVL